MPIPGKNLRPGFCDSDHTYPEIIIYQHGVDPVVLDAAIVSLDGQQMSDGGASIFSVTTRKDLGAASGTFSISLKPSKSSEELFKTIVDDAWIDIILHKNDQSFHVMRGLVDEIRRNRRVSGSGATSEVYTISGRDFGKIWEQTPVWFSPYDKGFLSGATSTLVFEGNPKNWDSPGKAPISLLKAFMRILTETTGVDWAPPPAMPGVIPGSFTANISFGDDPTGMSKYYQDLPPTKQFNPSGMIPDGMMWDLAKEYSDPMFTELYVDLLPFGDPFSNRMSLGDPFSVLETKMTVVLRNKPFPILPLSSFPGYVSTWMKLPTHMLARQEIVSDDIGRSGYERYNTFYAAQRMLVETQAADALYMMGSLSSAESVNKHGIRRLDIQSCAVPTGPVSDPLVKHQRNLIRDWYCMNPYLLSGTFQLGHGRPDIKIGNKLYLRGQKSVNPLDTEPDEIYYIETVDHTWTAGPGLRTNIGVTRGWIGLEVEYMAALAQVVARYAPPPLLTALRGV